MEACAAGAPARELQTEQRVAELGGGGGAPGVPSGAGAALLSCALAPELSVRSAETWVDWALPGARAPGAKQCSIGPTLQRSCVGGWAVCGAEACVGRALPGGRLVDVVVGHTCSSRRASLRPRLPACWSTALYVGWLCGACCCTDAPQAGGRPRPLLFRARAAATPRPDRAQARRTLRRLWTTWPASARAPARAATRALWAARPRAAQPARGPRPCLRWCPRLRRRPRPRRRSAGSGCAPGPGSRAWAGAARGARRTWRWTCTCAAPAWRPPPPCGCARGGPVRARLSRRRAPDPRAGQTAARLQSSLLQSSQLCRRMLTLGLGLR